MTSAILSIVTGKVTAAITYKFELKHIRIQGRIQKLPKNALRTVAFATSMPA